QLGDRLDRQIEPALARIFRKQRAVAGVDPSHDGRLVILQLRILGKVLGEMPEQGGRGGNADEEHDRAGREQEAEETYEEPHRRRPAATRFRSIAAVLSNPAQQDARSPATGLMRKAPRQSRLVALVCGQTEAGRIAQFDPPGPPAPASRVAKKVATACTMESVARARQLSDSRYLRSWLLDTYPSSTSTEGTSGAFSTRNPADFSGCLCNREVSLSSLTSAWARFAENVLVSRCTRSIRMSATSLGSALRSTPAMMSARFSASARRSASASEAVSESV